MRIVVRQSSRDSYLAEEEVGDEVEDQSSRAQASELSSARKTPDADSVQNAHEGVAQRDCKSRELKQGHEGTRHVTVRSRL